jgi:sensor histidine kinase YesM
VGVPMMYVWIMVMNVNHSFVTMWMAMGLARRCSLIMLVLMVLVVKVSMIVLNRFMLMLVFMPLSQVQPNANSHQRGGDHQSVSQTIAQDQKRNQRAHEWRQ